jgi:phospholipid/cholesterol/gamma-HCH transport system permease protein
MTATFEIRDEGNCAELRLQGDWILDSAAALSASLGEITKAPKAPKAKLTVDLTNLGKMDVAGAYLVDRTARTLTTAPIEFKGAHRAAERLIGVAHRSARKAPSPPAHVNALLGVLDRAGRGLARAGSEFGDTLAFLGETLAVLGKLAMRPSRIRWTSAVNVMELAGLDALPIISLLSFFIGVVIAYLGARTLSDFGVSVFTVELVGFSVFREFAVVITAVLLAGRTDSAFTAEIGAMKMRQEIDAMRVMGLDPVETLVAPRVIAMVVMTPILTFAAMIAGLLGGLLACWAYLHVSPAMFFARLHDGVPAQHFWVGMSKAPVFALVLAVVGCRHGLLVEGDVGSLGRRVTSSVVEAISVIIALDAIFAVWFLQVNL